MSQRLELRYSIDISAPSAAVWKAIWTPEHYEKWTSHFHPGSRYEGTLEEGEVLRFLGPTSDKGPSGMASKIVKWVPDSECCLCSLGMIVEGEIITEGEGAADWIGSREEYRLVQNGGVCSFNVLVESPESMREYFDSAWAKSLAELKGIAESLA